MIGIDIVHIPRIQKAVANNAFKIRVFTAEEIAYCDDKANPHIHYAGMFAAKEGAVKALKCGFSGGVTPLDIEITHDSDGVPKIVFHGRAKDLLADRAVDLSVSHDGEYAIAAVQIL